jgi:hypothetical protein
LVAMMKMLMDIIQRAMKIVKILTNIPITQIVIKMALKMLKWMKGKKDR